MKKLLVVLCAMLLVCPSGAAIRLPTNRAAIITVGPFFDKTDGVTPETAMTVTDITCELYKDSDAGGAGAAPTRVAITLAASGTSNDMALITDSASGCYKLELTAAQLNFKGRARLTLIDTDVMCPWWTDIVVEPNDIYDTFVSGSIGLADTDDHATATQTALTAQGLTEARATYLDLLADTTYGLAKLYDWIKAIIGNMD